MSLLRIIGRSLVLALVVATSPAGAASLFYSEWDSGDINDASFTLDVGLNIIDGSIDYFPNDFNMGL